MDHKLEDRTPPLARVMGVGRQQQLSGQSDESDFDGFNTLKHHMWPARTFHAARGHLHELPCITFCLN